MDIQRGLQVLELDRTATLQEVRQAYKDMVNVWHPDRFSHNPRLKAKAESKLKEINEAYKLVESFAAAKESEPAMPVDPATSGPVRGAGAKPQAAAPRAATVKVDRTEAVVEAGTRLFLTACAFVYKKLVHLAEDSTPQSNPAERPAAGPAPASSSGCRAEGRQQGRRVRQRGGHCGCGNEGGKG